MKIKCLFGLHKWKKYGGPSNIGGGLFQQAYICDICKKIKYKKY